MTLCSGGTTSSSPLPSPHFTRDPEFNLPSANQQQEKVPRTTLLLLALLLGIIMPSPKVMGRYIFFLIANLGAGGHILWVRRSPPALLNFAVPGRPCFISSDVFLFCFAFLSISLLASVFPVCFSSSSDLV